MKKSAKIKVKVKAVKDEEDRTVYATDANMEGLSSALFHGAVIALSSIIESVSNGDEEKRELFIKRAIFGLAHKCEEEF